jgi:ketosteroid isomerase-like protein
MSQENVEKVERFFERFNSRQIDAWAGMLAPDVEWHVDPQDPDTTVHRGREAARHYAVSWMEMMDASIELREVLDGGDQVVAWTRVEARGEASGVPVGMDLAFVLTLREGLITRVQEIQSKAEAREAAGLSE